jgi:hypothetical protein
VSSVTRNCALISGAAPRPGGSTALQEPKLDAIPRRRTASAGLPFGGSRSRPFSARMIPGP